jgi:hypothetical protein
MTVDNRFKDFPIDARFPSVGRDVRFEDFPTDKRFLDGIDTRFEGPAYGGLGLPGHVVTLSGWYEDGNWDIRVPTGEAISALIAWEFEGAWNIHTPTDPAVAPSWTVPDRAEAQGYTIWDIGVPT